MNKFYVYLCYSTDAGEDFRQDMKLLRDHLNTLKGVEVIQFPKEENNKPLDYYNNKIHNGIEKADLIIAECSYPSHLVGWVLCSAVESYRKEVLAVAEESAKVSKLLLGADSARHPNYFFTTYPKFSNLFDICTKKIEEVQNS